VVNLDSGDSVPLSTAEEKIPKCVNPLSLHIMRRTKEYHRFAGSQIILLMMMIFDCKSVYFGAGANCE